MKARPPRRAPLVDAEVEDAWSSVRPLARSLRHAPQARSPALSPDRAHTAYVGDRSGTPALWLLDGLDATPRLMSDPAAGPVVAASWTADGRWIAYGSSIGGGVRTEVTVVRPDGTDAHRVAGNPAHAILGPCPREAEMLVTICAVTAGGDNECVVVDAATGRRDLVVAEPTAVALDMSLDGRFVLVRTGTRGAYRCTVVDRRSGARHELLPVPEAGCTDAGLIRAEPSGEDGVWVAYLLTDAGLPRRSLLAVPFDHRGRTGNAGVIAGRDDADLEMVRSDRRGRVLVLAWNVAGRTTLDLYSTANGRSVPMTVPGEVVGGLDVSADGSRLAVSAEGPLLPPSVWHRDLDRPGDGQWQMLGDTAALPPRLAVPSLHRFESHDGLSISGWLYRSRQPAPDRSKGAVIVLHGGPEAEERPGFHPDHQILAAAGLNVFAPNIRGSSGSGRSFEHADDRYGRNDAIDDVAACAGYLVSIGAAEEGRIAVAGRSYGGYATLMALVRHRRLFRAGVDVCGMSDLLSFFAESEPWIGAAAVTKYGHPVTDAELLRALSPIHHASAIEAPVLIVHGALDTNVPVAESRRMAAALSSLGRDVEYLEIADEGHEFRGRGAKLAIDERTVAFLERVFVRGGA